MQVTRALLEMWSDSETEWWWQGTSVSYDRQGYIGQIDLFPGDVELHGGSYVLAIQNSNDCVCSDNCSPQGIAYCLGVTWAFSGVPAYRFYLPIIANEHPQEKHIANEVSEWRSLHPWPSPNLSPTPWPTRTGSGFHGNLNAHDHGPRLRRYKFYVGSTKVGLDRLSSLFIAETSDRGGVVEGEAGGWASPGHGADSSTDRDLPRTPEGGESELGGHNSIAGWLNRENRL